MSYCHKLAVTSVKLSVLCRLFLCFCSCCWNNLSDYLRNPSLPWNCSNVIQNLLVCSLCTLISAH